ncbi:MAG TPA: hypothetical protein PLT09_07250 [Deltaproteobacteria bacterium]|nr:hypothetical protein [Deltaproteobacteria bacterium]HPR54647.1 hypothetical protein [Deltaproteobacteria bacterium]HXK47221.1 hypothetical protein [Deltaproteobacteria bacterium]
MLRLHLIRISAITVLAAVLWGCPGGKPEIIEQKCSTCHSTSVVYAKKRTVDEWGRLVYGMKIRGLKLSAEEEKQVLGALAKHYSID